MKFDYNGKQYDIRLKSQYLPRELRNVGSFDLLLLIDNRTLIEVKQTILNFYIEGATICK